MSGEDKLSDMATHGAQPVHIVTENTGDSENIARGMAERAAGNEEAFETRSSATSSTPLSPREICIPEKSVAEKSPHSPSPEKSTPLSTPDKKSTPLSAPEKSASPNSNISSSKKPVTSSERADNAGKERDMEKGGYGGVLVISGLVLVIGGIVCALVQFTKKKRSAQ